MGYPETLEGAEDETRREGMMPLEHLPSRCCLFDSSLQSVNLIICKSTINQPNIFWSSVVYKLTVNQPNHSYSIAWNEAQPILDTVDWPFNLDHNISQPILDIFRPNL